VTLVTLLAVEFADTAKDQASLPVHGVEMLTAAVDLAVQTTWAAYKLAHVKHCITLELVQVYTQKKAQLFHITLTVIHLMHHGQDQVPQIYYTLYKHYLELHRMAHTTPAGTAHEAVAVITCRAVIRSYHTVFQVAQLFHAVRFAITE
jgi:hypothetical protein